MKDFRELKIWQKGVTFFELVVNDVGQFPKTEIAKIITNTCMKK